MGDYAMNKRNLTGLLLAAAVILISCLIPGTEQLGAAGVRAIGLVAAFLILLIFEALPIIITCLIFVALLPLLGITDSFNAALSGFSNQVVFFILASFGIAEAFAKVPLTTRMLAFLLRKFGRNIRTILLSMMVCAAVLSSIVSNVPTCAIFMALGLKFLEFYDREEDRRRTGRAFMIAIPVASMIGGMITPAGSSINLLAISLLEQHAGTTITFVQWMAYGIPLTLVMLPAAWILAVLVFRPAEIDRQQVHSFLQKLEAGIPRKIRGAELKVLVLTLIMLVLWIASSWVPSINVMVVAVLGCCAMFLPGIQVLDCRSFFREVSWDSFFLVGAVLSIGGAMVSSGVSAWITGLLPSARMPLPVFLGFITLLVFLLLVLIPVAPSLVTLMATPVISLCAAAGYSPALGMLILALAAGNCYLLPLDTVTLLTYGTGYYKMSDMPKCTVWLQLFMILAVSLLFPLILRLSPLG
mgnify:FL=1